jgi:hypothetical protein
VQKTFFIVSRKASFGASPRPSLSQFFNRTQRPTAFYAAALTGWNRRIFLLKLFNFSIPVAKESLKQASARSVHVKVIVKPARVV